MSDALVMFGLLAVAAAAGLVAIWVVARRMARRHLLARLVTDPAGETWAIRAQWSRPGSRAVSGSGEADRSSDTSTKVSADSANSVETADREGRNWRDVGSFLGVFGEGSRALVGAVLLVVLLFVAGTFVVLPGQFAVVVTLTYLYAIFRLLTRNPWSIQVTDPSESHHHILVKGWRAARQATASVADEIEHGTFRPEAHPPPN